MAYDSNTTRRDTNLRPEAPVSTGIPFWDLMLSFGKASQQAMATYAPRAEHATQPSRAAVQQTGSSVEVIPVGEETLNVGTRVVAGETTRVRRIVVESPVEQSVSLREERVIVERRKPTGASAVGTQAILTESTIEMSDSFEVAEVWKSVRVTEEVVLRREVTERQETVRETVRHDEVVVEQVTRAVPAIRHEAETVKQDYPAAPQPKVSKPEPAQLAADLKKVAERFETSAEQHDKATAPKIESAKTEPAKAEQKPAAPQASVQSSKAASEQPKTPAMPGRPEASGTQNEKSNFSQKN